MSWGTELWDQFDKIENHTQKGLDYCERYQHFIKERCAIELDYVSKLKKLVKNYSYQPSKKKEKDDHLQHNLHKLQRSVSNLQRTKSLKLGSDDDLRFSTHKSFQSMVKELHDMAGQHETIAENFNVQVVHELQQLIHTLKQQRKQHLQDGTKQMSQLQAQLNTLEKSKKQYEKAFRDAEKAQDAYKKADADINLSRAEVEKAKNQSFQKQQHCEECKNEYAAELQKTNQAQQEHYHTLMPAIFRQLQEMDENRIKRLAEFIRLTAEVEKNVLPIISTCIEGTFRAADAIDPSSDSKIVIERYRSGLTPPADYPFEDLSSPGSENNFSSHTPKNATLRTDSQKGTTSDRSRKGRKGLFAIFSNSKIAGANPTRERSLRSTVNGLSRQSDDGKEDFSDRPPAQQQKKLMQKIEELRTQVTKETAERNGLLNLRDAYVRNPAHGDPSSLDKQLEDNATRLDKLRQELQKFEGYLQEAEARTKGGGGHSTSDDSITHSMSEVSVGSHHQGSAPGTPNVTHTNRDHQGNQDSDEWSDDGSAEACLAAGAETTSGRGTRGSPDSGVDNTQSAHYAEQDSFDDGLEEFPIIGTARALYSFDACNEGSIDMHEGDQYDILEADQGDGWTRVRKANGEEGFVPTSYLETKYD